ncbi:MAG: kelch repeat-containing protein [Ignavibacteriaceae bacterium]|nr:kelch repeat-containing protein [Ignavibacteriaceae bacterium]
MPNSVYGAQAVVKDSVIYVLGGFSEIDNSAVKKIRAYNPADNTWKDVAQMNSRRFDFTAGIYSDSIIFFGGVSPLSQNSASIEVWDFNSAPRIYDTNMNFNRQQATGRIVNGNIYIFGGQASGVSYLVIYDIAKAKVVYSSDFSFGMQFPLDQMSVVSNNNIYLFGGAFSVLMNSIYKLNTSDNSFKKLSGKLLKPRAGGVAVSASNNSIYIVGGFDERQVPISDVEVININNDEIESEDGPSLNFPRSDPIVVNYNNSIYVMGGLDKEGQPVNAIEKLDIVTDVKNISNNIPGNFVLENNYPNPFNPTTNIAFKISRTTKVSLDIYSILGQYVRNITSKEFTPGEYTFTWNGQDDHGNNISSGIYIYRLTSNYFNDAKKMVFLK